MNPAEIMIVAISCLYLVHSYVKLRRDRRLYFLHIGSSYLVLTTFLSFPLVKFQQYGAVDATTSTRVLIVACIFISLAWACQFLFYGRKMRQAPTVTEMTAMSNCLLGLLFLAGGLAFIRFFVLNQAYGLIGDVFFTVSAGGAYYDARDELGSWITRNTGLGVASATLAFNCIFPIITAAGLMAFKQTRNMVYLVLVLASTAMSVLIALVLSDRFYILFSVVFPLLCVAVISFKGDVEKRLASIFSMKGLLTAMALVVGAATLLYSFTDQEDISTSLLLAVNRILVVPAMTSSFYYSLFPDMFAYRGIEHSFLINVDSQFGGSTSIREVSYAATGSPINANTGILATAYTGDGYTGVFIVSVVFLVLTVAIDRLFARFEGLYRVINILINLAGFMAITNVSFLVATNAYGYGLGSIALLIVLYFADKKTPVPRLARVRSVVEIGG